MTLQRSKAGSSEIAAAIRSEIARGGLQPHTALPGERQLAATYGVSRGTVRHALDQLEREGLVETRRGSGSYVSAGGAADPNSLFESARPLELIDARFALEPHICRLAVLHARARDFDELEALLAGMEASLDDPVVFSEVDSTFHARLAEATGNSLLVWIISQINSVRSREEWTRMRELTLDAATITQYNAQHRAVVDALRARQPQRAAALMKEHLETARLSLTRAAAT